VQTRTRFGVWEWSALAGYAALVVAAVRRHLSWADEAQAWLIARDCSLREIFLHRLHYEGTPGLWHLLLWVLVRLGMPFEGLHWVSAVLAVGGVVVWLRYSPFSRVLKLLFPFTFFMAYQYAVVMRSYVLFPLLVFSACALMGLGYGPYAEKHTPRPIWLAVVLGLLANLCMYGTMCAVGLAIVYADRMWKLDCGEAQKRFHAHCKGAAAIFLVMCAIAVATAWPAKDVAFTTGVMELPAVQKLLHRDEPVTVNEANREPSWTMNPADEKLTPPHTGNLWKDRLWLDSHKFYNGAMQPTRHVYRTQRFIFAASLLMFPLAGHLWLAYAAVAALIYRCGRQRFFVAILPYGLIFVASIMIYSAEHHAGLLLVAFVAVAWVTWTQKIPVRGLDRWIELGLRGALLVIFIVQIGWTLHAMRAERITAYAGDKAAADFLHAQAAGKKIAGYYPLKIYFNQPTSYWQYSKDPKLTMSNADVLAAKPDYVVLGTTAFRQQMIFNQFLPMLDTEDEEPGDILRVGDFFAANGYQETHRFCGQAPMRYGFSSELCQVVLEPVR